jgi:hypothetical protein
MLQRTWFVPSSLSHDHDTSLRSTRFYAERVLVSTRVISVNPRKILTIHRQTCVMLCPRRGGVLLDRSTPYLHHLLGHTPTFRERASQSKGGRLRPPSLSVPLRRGSSIPLVPSPSYVSRSTYSTPPPQPTGTPLHASLELSRELKQSVNSLLTSVSCTVQPGHGLRIGGQVRDRRLKTAQASFIILFTFSIHKPTVS